MVKSIVRTPTFEKGNGKKYKKSDKNAKKARVSEKEKRAEEWGKNKKKAVNEKQGWRNGKRRRRRNLKQE
jgi:hypothetical protein